MKKNMAITMVKDVFKEPHFQIKPTHIIFRFLVPFLLIGIGILFYSSMQKGTPYEFPFSKEEHKKWLYTAVTRGAQKIVLVRP